MKSITYSENSLKGRFLCSLFGHKFHITKVVTGHFKEFECSVCHLQVTNDANGHRVNLNHEHREINNLLLELYYKRHIKSLHQ